MLSLSVHKDRLKGESQSWFGTINEETSAICFHYSFSERGCEEHKKALTQPHFSNF